ncbi:hypothetical protein [Paenibacillus peoriae]|uniref:hypothetical protein n=1 Tax=Paenibacillus peoriae TaxID=59893 RepID=UPI0009BFDFD0|nr:hypothetical protein [Paenibacillus peoriae]
MSIEAHRCNVSGCKGFIVFENADFDSSHPPIVNGEFEFDNPCCTECGKEFKVVPYYAVISLDEDGNIEDVESACITEWEKRERQRQFDAETDPSLRIMNFLVERGYTYTVSDVIANYSRHQEIGCYLSYTMKDCIDNLESEIKSLLREIEA